MGASINLPPLDSTTMTDTVRPPESTPASMPAEPAAVPGQGTGAKEKPALDPTRYGDWEKNGRCIDF